MNLDIITDAEGKEYQVFDSSELYDDKKAGNHLSDFIFLQKLGKGGFGSVSKVRSKINGKIYALKTISAANSGDSKYEDREKVANSLFSHPNVIKYHHYFIDRNGLHIVIEFMDNGDLSGFLKAHKILKRPIEEGVLWNILYQCISGLNYLHKKNIIHRDIKPQNIFINNNMTIKIGDLGVFAKDKNDEPKNKSKTTVANEEKLLNNDDVPDEYHNEMTHIFNRYNPIILGDYSKEIDIFNMGETLYELCFHHLRYKIKYTTKNGISEPSYEENHDDENDSKVEQFYSKELLDLIKSMIKKNNTDIPKSGPLFKTVKKEYAKRYFGKNSGIESVVKCLSYFPLREEIEINDLEKKPNSAAFLDCLKALNKYEEKDREDAFNELRQQLASENYNLDEEVKPIYVLRFLMEKIHRELNTKNTDSKEDIDETKYLINIYYEQKKLNKFEMLFNFVNNFRNQFNSIISDCFLGLISNTYTCNNKYCNLTTYSFNNFCFITIDMKKEREKDNKFHEIDLLKYMKSQNEEVHKRTIYCSACCDLMSQTEKSQYYSMPLCLIFYIQRDDKSNEKVIIKKSLNVSEIVEWEKSPKCFSLVGLITKEKKDDGKEHYNWFSHDACYPPHRFNDAKQEDVIMLFYDGIDNNSYLI